MHRTTIARAKLLDCGGDLGCARALAPTRESSRVYLPPPYSLVLSCIVAWSATCRTLLELKSLRSPWVEWRFLHRSHPCSWENLWANRTPFPLVPLFSKQVNQASFISLVSLRKEKEKSIRELIGRGCMDWNEDKRRRQKTTTTGLDEKI